jgi:hypothetical protein
MPLALDLAFAAALAIVASSLTLDGVWTSPDMRFEIDQANETGRVDTGSSQRFRVDDVQGTSIVFDIGPRRFFGLLTGDTLIVTSREDPAPRTLIRSMLRPSLDD